MKQIPASSRRDGERGQVMAIFSLVAVLLFVIAGLSVDAGMSYLTSDNLERAAASAALAGVAYLPGDYNSAQNAALVEAARNGFANQGSSNNCNARRYPCVVTSQPQTNQLTVTITTNVNTTFLRLVGFGKHTVTRSATAEYLPPIQLGQPGGQQGSDLSSTCDGIGGAYCSAPTSGLGSGGSNYYFERSIGWGNPRSEGDPLTPTPYDTATGCSGMVCTANPADAHLISQQNGSAPADTTLNYPGGYSYLIDVPPGKKADVQIFNPSFAPDSCDQPYTTHAGCTQNSFYYSYHEDDGSFPDGSTTATDYSAMSYSVYSIATLSSHLYDRKLSQEIFYPYNATGLYRTSGASRSYSYFPHTGTGAATTVTNYVPQSYHAWLSGLQYAPTNANDVALFTHNYFNSFTSTQYLDNTGGSVDKYYRLQVDNLTWDGQPTCTNSTCTTPDGASSTNGYSKAHKGYAVRVVAAPGASCSTCTISAMGDMTLYTPVNSGSSSLQFSIPLFQLDAAYAGRTITVDVFDPGDVGGTAYMGLQLPGSTSFATATSMITTGTSLGAGGTTTVPSLGTWPGSTGGACSACFQTAAGGGAIYNGQWIQMQIQVPSSFNSSSYWNLVYDVGPNTQAGDTFSVRVGFAGSPDHLVP